MGYSVSICLSISLSTDSSISAAGWAPIYCEPVSVDRRLLASSDGRIDLSPTASCMPLSLLVRLPLASHEMQAYAYSRELMKAVDVMT